MTEGKIMVEREPYEKDGKTFHGVMVLVVVSSAPELG